MPFLPDVGALHVVAHQIRSVRSRTLFGDPLLRSLPFLGGLLVTAVTTAGFAQGNTTPGAPDASPSTITPTTSATAASTAPVSTDRGLAWGGRVRFGILLESGFTSGEAGADADLHARTPEAAGFFAQAEVGLDHDSQDINPHELFVGRAAGEGREWRFGLQEKPFGLDSFLEDEERLTIDTPVVYDKLEEFSYVGREIRLALVDVQNGDEGLDLHASVGSGSATNFNALLAAGEFSPEAPVQFSAFALVQGQRYRSKREFVWSVAATGGQRLGVLRWNAEAMYGKDPYETEWERTFGRKTTVYFWSAQGVAGYDAWVGDGWRLVPYLGGSYFVPRQSRSKKNTLQSLAGVRYEGGPLRAGIEANLVGTTKQDKDERSWKRSKGRFELAYAF